MNQTHDLFQYKHQSIACNISHIELYESELSDRRVDKVYWFIISLECGAIKLWIMMDASLPASSTRRYPQ